MFDRQETFKQGREVAESALGAWTTTVRAAAGTPTAALRTIVDRTFDLADQTLAAQRNATLRLLGAAAQVSTTSAGARFGTTADMARELTDTLTRHLMQASEEATTAAVTAIETARGNAVTAADAARDGIDTIVARTTRAGQDATERAVSAIEDATGKAVAAIEAAAAQSQESADAAVAQLRDVIAHATAQVGDASAAQSAPDAAPTNGTAVKAPAKRTAPSKPRASRAAPRSATRRA